MQTPINEVFRGTKILQDILKKDVKTDFDIARGISIIEENGIEIAVLESMLKNPLGHEVKRIGITGAPGVGKSTFMNSLLVSQDLSNHKIAVIAVDPSSRRTNGAVLGDRIRITQSAIFEKIYFRSMATRGAYGGLNSSIDSVLHFLVNCGFTLIFLETVGVGQNEVDVTSHVDLVVHILDSNLGDEVQLEKAGVMEVGNVFFVNTRDGKVNHEFVTSLKSFTLNSNKDSSMKPQVVVGSAISGEGIEEVTRLLLFTSFNHLQTEGLKNDD